MLPTAASPDQGALCDAWLLRQDGAMQGESNRATAGGMSGRLLAMRRAAACLAESTYPT